MSYKNHLGKEMEITAPQQDSVNQKPWEFGGWLFLLGFGITISPLRILSDIFNTYPTMFTDGTLEDVIENASFAFISLVATEFIANIIFVILSLVLVFLFYKKKSIFPKWYLITAIATLSFIVIDNLIISSMFPEIEFMTVDTIKVITGGLIALLVWSPYLFISERSKNTFIL